MKFYIVRTSTNEKIMSLHKDTMYINGMAIMMM